MKENNFFDNQTISSKIKASIISEYFPSYCKIIVKKHPPKEIRYIDLFSGPGIYKDGNPSTPILIGRYCMQDEFLRKNVKMIFNDNQFHKELKENFENEFPKDTFSKTIHFGRSTVGENKRINEFLIKSTHKISGKQSKNDFPSLLFIDPFGYKGIETKILAEFLKNWGNEIFIFVNTKRIHAAIENDKFEELMYDLFPNTFQKLKLDRRFKATVPERLNLIIDKLGEEYKIHLGNNVYYTAFKFQEEDSEATSHYILHLTKGLKGYELIKQTYTNFANVGTIFDGVNTYTFDAKKYGKEINELFDLSLQNIENLADKIYNKYKGKSITALSLFEDHHKNELYSLPHYRKALRKLVEDDKIIPTFTDNKRHSVSVVMSKDCLLKFK